MKIHVYHHFEDDQTLKRIETKLDALIKHNLDEEQIRELTEKLDKSTNALKEAVDRNS